jgi:hypothetical protein
MLMARNTDIISDGVAVRIVVTWVMPSSVANDTADTSVRHAMGITSSRNDPTIRANVVSAMGSTYYV